MVVFSDRGIAHCLVFPVETGKPGCSALPLPARKPPHPSGLSGAGAPTKPDSPRDRRSSRTKRVPLYCTIRCAGRGTLVPRWLADLGGRGGCLRCRLPAARFAWAVGLPPTGAKDKRKGAARPVYRPAYGRTEEKRLSVRRSFYIITVAPYKKTNTA